MVCGDFLSLTCAHEFLGTEFVNLHTVFSFRIQSNKTFLIVYILCSNEHGDKDQLTLIIKYTLHEH